MGVGIICLRRFGQSMSAGDWDCLLILGVGFESGSKVGVIGCKKMSFHCNSRADGVDFCIQFIHNPGKSEFTNDDILAVEQTDPHLTLKEGNCLQSPRRLLSLFLIFH